MEFTAPPVVSTLPWKMCGDNGKARRLHPPGISTSRMTRIPRPPVGLQWSPRAHNLQGQPWIPHRSQQRGTHGWPCIAGGTDKNAAHREIRANLMITAAAQTSGQQGTCASEPEAPVAAEPTADPQPAEDAAPASPQAPAVEAVEASPAKAAAAPAETPEEAKVEKKEKSPKDLAKLAQRFSGRLFGAVGEKKKEPTQEEEAEWAAPAEPAPVSDAAPQIPANTTPEVS
ncbi:hypothetical protein PTTG_29379 [Puccinia triticina 1-1 BBBD Race 1]|uniref:Uncharacterized protein n=1 Tax=Puccinia triticina (isolate 1-1 / race 1 (BBBD)) TaxID=630390 RepID=A0A180G4R1_PUCT1|nr:hypothetical protein PTTG_29379 [Puccinia triticina 1-1 BBBD Race 1]